MVVGLNLPFERRWVKRAPVERREGEGVSKGFKRGSKPLVEKVGFQKRDFEPPPLLKGEGSGVKKGVETHLCKEGSSKVGVSVSCCVRVWLCVDLPPADRALSRDRPSAGPP